MGGVRKNIYLRTVKLRNSRCRSRTDYFKIMTLAWYSVPLICKRRMKDSNLQVVSDWLVSNQLQYHYGNTACDGILPKLPSFMFLEPTKLGKLFCDISEMRFCWTVISHKTGSVIFHVYTHYCAHVRLQLITASSPQRYWVDFHL